jgi:hypothetical protein
LMEIPSLIVPRVKIVVIFLEIKILSEERHLLLQDCTTGTSARVFLHERGQLVASTDLATKLRGLS